MSNSETPDPGTEQRILRSSTARNPRRRPRQSDNDTLPIQAPKRRRRNDLKADTFKPRDSTENVPSESQQSDRDTVVVNGNGHLHANGGVRTASGTYRNASHADNTPMTIRNKRKGAPRNDGATTLVENKCHSFKLLNTTPKELRAEGVRYRGSIGGAGLALALSHDAAIVWDYTANLTATNPRTLEVPFPSQPDDPLPFGALIPNGSTAGDVGVLIIGAASGKLAFYESIEHARSLSLFHARKTGVEGSIGCFSGETVVDLVSADHAGFVVVLSSGRLVQLVLRDAQGKPKISSDFMRITEVSGGLLSSFGRLWSGGFRKDLAGVRTRPLNIRGSMQAVGITERAEILVWDMDWSGRSEYKSTIPFWDVLTGELKALEAPEWNGKADSTIVLDFAIFDKAASTARNEIATIGTEPPLSMLLLLRVGSADMYAYALAEVSIHEGSAEVSRIYQLSSYQSTRNALYQRKPRLSVPNPGHTALVAFEDAIVLVSTQEPESPEAQLHASYIQPESYEEVVYLRPEVNLAFQSVWDEGLQKQSSHAIAFVNGAGLVRITAVNAISLPGGSRISAKSRIEQAVFYGALQPDNIIDFSKTSNLRYSVEEVEEASLEVSQAILRAETSFPNIISATPTSMESHLATKAKALKALARVVRQSYPALSPSTMWHLLWDAERVAACRQLCVAFEEHVQMSLVNGKRKATMFDETCAWFVTKEWSFTQRNELKDEDPVRMFFIAGSHHLGQLLVNVTSVLKALKADNGKPSERELLLVYQANDIYLRSLETAFRFRSDNSRDYGILPDMIEDGVLIDSAEFVNLPEFWTSTEPVTNSTVSVANISRHFATEYYEPKPGDRVTETLQDIALSNPKLTRIYCYEASEAIRWQASRGTAHSQELSKQMQAKFDERRYALCRQLADVGQADQGMKLAEKYHDMNTLTDMVIAEEQYIHEEMHNPNASDNDPDGMLRFEKDLHLRIHRYFEKYGGRWSNAFFDKLFSSERVGIRFEEAQKRWKRALTEYLRSSPSRAKICWINDITRQEDFAHAGEALAQSAELQESKLWAKKVELSMSKLAMLAASEAGQSTSLKLPIGAAVRRNAPGRELAVLDVQQKLYRHLYQELVGFIDQEAQVQHCIDKYSKHTEGYPALRQLLENGLTLLLGHAALSLEQLIDVLTLMDSHDVPDGDSNLESSEFFCALHALDAAAPGLPPNRFETLQQIIWKRCFIYDDWARLNLSKKKTDEERKQTLRKTVVWQTLYHGLNNGYLTQPDRQVKILMPSECLGSACQPQDLNYRFPSEDLLDPILHDCKIQDELLQSFVADRHLDEIAEECRRDVQDLLHERAKEQAQLMLREREAEVAVPEAEGLNGDLNGHVKGANGYHEDESVQYSDEMLDGAEDGDAEME